MKTPFPLFHQAYAPGGTREAYDPSRHESFATKVPAELTIEWRNFGFGAYGGGILGTVVPDQPFLNTGDWPFLDGTGIEVLRTAFADVCLWQGGRFVWLNVHTGKIASFSPRADVMFESTLIEANFRKSVLLERLFRSAKARFGELEYEECFGFAPLPAPGAAMAEEHLIKTSMRDYVASAGRAMKRGN